MKFERHLPWLFVSIIASIAILLLPSPMTPVVLAAAQPSGWIELIDERTPVGKKYLNLTDGRISITTSLAQIHYESTPDSGVYDAEVDFTPRRVNNARLDGWTVTQNGWHYALGQPSDKSTDGWVGFGGRQGDHWVKFRLARVGYLHWPTRTWDDLGGSPTYDRANLVSITSSSEYGHGNLVNVQTTATWANIWITPDGGSLNISWRANADGLKEDIIINQAAREWLAVNRPPSTPATETWFGFALEVDWSDIPRIMRAGLELSPNDDFADDGQGIELRDALDRFLAFLPIGDVRVLGDGSLENPDDVEPLRKRFWLDGDGNNYVLVGVRLPELAGMQAGDLVFDPTVDVQVGAGGDDGLARRPSDAFDPTGSVVLVGARSDGTDKYQIWARFIDVDIPNGATIDSAKLIVESESSARDGANVLTNIYMENHDDAAAPVDGADYNAKAKTTAFVVWDGEDFVVDTPTDSPDISTVVKEVIDRPGWSSGNALQILWDEDGSTTDFYYRLHSYEGDSSKAIKLHIEYSTPWSNSAPIITNKITSDSGDVSTAYSRQFDATDADSNQTLIWEINATDAAFLSIDSLNRTTYINGTLPSSEGTYYVNVTVGDQASPNATDFVNYTLNVVATIENFWGSTEGVIFIIGLIALLIFIVLGILIAPAVWVMGGIVSFFLGFVAYDATLSVWIVPIFAFLGIAFILGGALKTKEGF